MKLNYILVMALLSFCLSGWAQQKSVTGTVTDEQGVPLAGTNILEAGTSNGVQADFDGNYSISVGENATLIFSYVGMLTQNISVSGKSEINVTLIEDAAQLDEVVVVGYGSQKKVNLTGSVETVKADEITRQPVAQASQALAGLVPGLTAVQSSGQPGRDNATIRIRGIGTLGSGAKNNPLILVDGIPDSINGLDPNDIESISVLKDASAAAIYGSRAANGVILITTKRGKEGKIRASYNSYVGVQDQTQNLDFLNSLEYMEAFNDAEPGSFPDSVLDQYRAGVGLGTEALPNTDWVDLAFSEPGFQHYHNLSVNGGSEKARVAASISYLDQDGNIANFNFKRYSGRFNTDLKIGEKFEVGFDLNFRKEVDRAPGDLQQTTKQINRLQPLFNAYNDDGTWGAGFNGGNPIARIHSGSLDERVTNYFRGVLKLKYKPTDDLSIAATYSPQYNDFDRDNFNATWVWKDGSNAEPETDHLLNNSLLKQTNQSFTDNFNVVINYSKDFGDHSVSALAGYEFLKFQYETWNASRRRFVLQEFRNLNNGDSDTQLNSGSSTQNGLESVFGRINYAYKGKYLFEANVRRDASSRFAEGFRASTFPSFSLGWRVSEEDFFLDDSFINNLKIRGSWGQLGNQFIYDNNGNAVNFAYASLFGVGNANPTLGGVPIVGGAQSVLANSELQWETGETANIAVDAGMFNNRLTFTGEFYVRKTKDILLDVTIPTSVGFGAPTQNAGEVKNTGYDISLGWQDNIGDVKYGINFNYSDFKNEITDLGGLDQLPPGNTINRLGEEIGAIYGLKEEGLYQESDFTGGVLNAGLPVPSFGAIQAGDIKYVDLNDDGVINNDDRTVIGSALSTKNWGFDFFVEYKGFDLSASVIGVGGRDVVLQSDIGYSFFNAGKIQRWQTDYWTPENTDASLPRLTALSAHHNWRVNETWMHDASYVRVRNITLGYKLPSSVLDKVNLSNARLYISGQNLFTFDNMPDGIDPLVSNFNQGHFYPISKVFTLGVNVGF
ncbi:SusC/RagA family TonB-linked outer membrane protein [Seonamhaeicola maritimus]|uniref:TonB-dependent receptor n=1 Tax=Seonamhaeicola maritimus TaxID=2591822 RepID=A0A5C7GFP6_9FLAO|nr:TonB-dependent receptor [Seonamhaeicola maritimus]TXG36105.1 TonB-dependent receptor [Seonamhaeicola maritimus]